MGLFNWWIKKKEVELPEEEDFETLEKVDFTKLSKEDRNRFVEEQCEIIVQSNNSMDSAKREYKIVSSYFSDIQVIEGQSKSVRDRITYLAKSISDLMVDRKMLYTGEKKISGTRYLQLAEEEDTIVDGIKGLKNNEIYLQVVKKDMSALNGEKAALKLDIKELTQRQSIIKNISIVLVICFAIIFCMFVFSGMLEDSTYSVYFYVILFIGALFAAGDVVLYQRTVYNILLTERKINRAIAIHNKIKIKFINTTNLIQYKYAKYGVKSSYELADLYQRYLETKMNREKYKKATMELSDDEEELEKLLGSLGLYDAKIWLTQVKALCDTKEMVEVRHEYSVRRQGLRKIIEDNSKQSEDAKTTLRKLIKDYPELAPEVLAIVDKYD